MCQAEDRAVNKSDKNFALTGLTFYWEEWKINKINMLNVYALEMKMKEKTKQGGGQEVLEKVWVLLF